MYVSYTLHPHLSFRQYSPSAAGFLAPEGDRFSLSLQVTNQIAIGLQVPLFKLLSERKKADRIPLAVHCDPLLYGNLKNVTAGGGIPGSIRSDALNGS